MCVVIKIRFPRTAAGVGRVSRQGGAHAKVIKDVVDDDAGEILYDVNEAESSGNAKSRRVTPINTTRRFIMCRDESMMAHFNIKRRRRPGKLSERFN